MGTYPKNVDVARYERLGVDLSLLWENLKRPPTERVLRHQNMLALVDEVRKKGPLRGRVRKAH